MTESLGRSGEVMAFLREGDPGARRQEISPSRETTTPLQARAVERIAVTVRLPRNLAHALIDASAERRKARKPNWSQQEIVAEALVEWMSGASSLDAGPESR